MQHSRVNPFDVEEMEMDFNFLVDGSVEKIVALRLPGVEAGEIRAVNIPRNRLLPGVTERAGIFRELFAVLYAEICKIDFKFEIKRDYTSNENFPEGWRP